MKQPDFDTQTSNRQIPADGITDTVQDALQATWHDVIHSIREFYEHTTERLEDEFTLTVSEQQVNDALTKFVTNKVQAILDIHVDIHDGWFRLYCTANYQGIYAQVASNFTLVHVQLDRNRQRLVFGQQTDTDILSLHCTNYLKTLAIRSAIWCYRRFLKKDPLAEILNRIKLTKTKENIFYLDLHRWLKKNKKIMDTLKKVQVNDGNVATQQLLLKAQVNVRDVLSGDTGSDIITEADAPPAVEDSAPPPSETSSKDNNEDTNETNSQTDTQNEAKNAESKGQKESNSADTSQPDKIQTTNSAA